MFSEIISIVTSITSDDPLTWLLHQLYFGSALEHKLSVIIILSLVLMMALEKKQVTAWHEKSRMLQSYHSNIATFLFNNILISALSLSAVLVSVDNYQYTGIIRLEHWPFQMLAAFLLYDLTQYLWHLANHKFNCLWMFHKVHHSDVSMNSSTAFRVHFIEILFSNFVKIAFIFLTGIEVSLLVVYEAITTLFIMLHHLHFSIWGEKWLKYIIIVPMQHRIHHSPIRQEHDSNYGAVLSLWDRMFRTLHDAGSNKIGLQGVNALTFFQLLTFGFVNPVAVSGENNRQAWARYNIDRMIAEAAYYLAEKRGFVAGDDQLDWYIAEQQIKAQLEKYNKAQPRESLFKSLKPVAA